MEYSTGPSLNLLERDVVVRGIGPSTDPIAAPNNGLNDFILLEIDGTQKRIRILVVHSYQ